MVATYDESFEKYHIENGNFEYKEAASKEAIQAIEAEGVKLYENYFYEQTVEKDGKESTLRIFKNRTEVDKVCLMKGEMPADADEIAIDRMYAVNNEINVGDTISVDGIDYKVSGYVALSDYSALFQSNSVGYAFFMPIGVQPPRIYPILHYCLQYRSPFQHVNA